MNKTVCFLAVLLIFLPVLDAAAQLVSVQCIEVIADESAAEYPQIPSTTRWETGAMNTLFDSGYIVSSMPALRSGKRELPQGSLESALAAGVDLLLCVYLSFDVRTDSGGLRPAETLAPNSLYWELYTPLSGFKRKSSGSWKITEARNEREELRNAEAMAGSIVAGLKGR